jgi:hypothetical protein
MSRTKEQEWGDNPRLNAWRAAQQAAFETWAEEAGGAWDFTPDSVDRLEEAIRSRFSTWDEASEAEDGPFLSPAAWYFGEVQVRNHGAIWQWCPTPAQPPNPWDKPFVTLPAVPAGEGEQREELYEDEDYVPGCTPIDEICSLFARGPEHRLRDVLKQYAG